MNFGLQAKQVYNWSSYFIALVTDNASKMGTVLVIFRGTNNEVTKLEHSKKMDSAAWFKNNEFWEPIIMGMEFKAWL